MISNPGDNRTALIAALIAIPASCLITMIIHTFVPITNYDSMVQYAAIVGRETASSEAVKGPKASIDPRKKAALKKRFAAARKARMETLKKIADLAQEKAALLEKDPKCPPAKLICARTESLLAQGNIIRSTEKIRIMGTPFSDTAVKAFAAAKIAALDKAALKEGKKCKIAALESEINALRLELQLKNNRLYRIPEWREACNAFRKTPTLENLKGMYAAEAANQRMRHHRRH